MMQFEKVAILKPSQNIGHHLKVKEEEPPLNIKAEVAANTLILSVNQ